MDDQYATFGWGTDVDVPYGDAWLFNYIKNRSDTSGWVGHWEKGGITVPISRPLPSGKYICREIFLGRFAQEPDTDAPIIYGTSNQLQPAAVFEKDSSLTRSELSAYLSITSPAIINDKEELIFLEMSVAQKDTNLVAVRVSLEPDTLYVGFSNVEKSLGYTDERFLRAVDASKSATMETLADFSPEAAGDFQYLYEEKFIFVNGDVDIYAEVEENTSSDAKILTHVVVFDSERQPIFSTYIDLPVLGR